jgi:endonuclease YncB( thermonuclease family)
VWAKAVDVYDGDTLNLTFHLYDHLVQFRVRTLGYDSPEMKPSKEIKNRENEIAGAIRARNRLINLVSDIPTSGQQRYTKKEIQDLLATSKKLIIAQFYKFDKYGRPLAKLYTKDHACINQMMIDEGHGYEYHGGNKKKAAAASRRSSVGSNIYTDSDE